MLTVALPTAEYRRIRNNDLWFFVLPEHQLAAIENIVERHPDYLVVEKSVDPESSTS